MERQVSGYILSGGKNSRMNGEKKLFLLLDGIPFYQHILRALSPLPSVRLSVERPEPYAHLGLELVVDEIPDIGPMGGLYSGLRSTPSEALLVVPCDMPLVGQATVHRLLSAYERYPVVTVVTQGNVLRPFPGIYPKRCLPVLGRMIQAGKYRMMDFLKQLPELQSVPALNSQTFQNVNTPEDYQHLAGNRPIRLPPVSE